MTTARITVVIPVLDEATNIDSCLAAVFDQDIDPDAVEVLVVDGGSADATADRAAAALATAGRRGRIIINPGGDRPSNLNRGLAEATGDFLVRVDARSRLPRHYIAAATATLRSRPEVVVTGGRQVAVATGTSTRAEGIARALNNRWTTGLARYRRARTAGPADTVYLGVFRTAEVRAAGGWRADLAVNEDFDLNRRLRGEAGVIWFDPDLSVGYVPRASLPDVIRQYHAFGRGKGYYWRTSGDRPRPRQWLVLAAPLAATAGFVAGIRAPSPWPAVTVVTVAAGAAVVEVAGNRSPGRIGAHVVALAASAAIAAGWLSGVARAVVRPERRNR